MREYELKLYSGRVVMWSGTSGEDAAQRYMDTHPYDTVIAWRFPDHHGVFEVNVRDGRISIE